MEFERVGAGLKPALADRPPVTTLFKITLAFGRVWEFMNLFRRKKNGSVKRDQIHL